MSLNIDNEILQAYKNFASLYGKVLGFIVSSIHKFKNDLVSFYSVRVEIFMWWLKRSVKYILSYFRARKQKAFGISSERIGSFCLIKRIQIQVIVFYSVTYGSQK